MPFTAYYAIDEVKEVGLCFERKLCVQYIKARYQQVVGIRGTCSTDMCLAHSLDPFRANTFLLFCHLTNHPGVYAAGAAVSRVT